MAPPARDKKRGASETVDSSNRIHKHVNNTGRGQSSTAILTRSASNINAAISSIAAHQGPQAVLPHPNIADADMVVDSPSSSIERHEEFPQPSSHHPNEKLFWEGTATDQFEPPRPDLVSDDEDEDEDMESVENKQKSNLMSMARGLLNLVGPYLEEMEDICPSAGADFLALISDGVSRAIRGENIYTSVKASTMDKVAEDKRQNKTWAAKAAAGNKDNKNVDLRRAPRRPSPPQHQSKEDKRIMIRLDSKHEARNAEPFLLRQQVQRLVPDPTLVVDAWQVPSGIAVLAPTAAKAASILQHKDTIAARFGNAKVERQEKWTTFVIGPVPKNVTTLDGAVDPLEGLLQSEPSIVDIKDAMPIRHIAWTQRSKDSAHSFGYIRIHVPEAKANKFPSRIQLFGQATSVQRIRQRSQLITCTKCFGFHSTRTCARQQKCGSCGKDSHEGSCTHPIQCLNCRGPHKTTDVSCPARPRKDHGVFVRPTGAQLRHIRAAGRKEHSKSLRSSQEPSAATQSTTVSPPSSN